MVTRAVDPGLVKVIEEEIVPRLERDIPGLASAPDHPLGHRLRLVFDREGYSPVLFARMRKKHIACSTYRRKPGPDWPAEEFEVEPVILTNGETVEMMLAERGVFLERAGLWAREVRRRAENGGHQTAIVSTDYLSPRSQLAAPMFGRWGQENFFRYMLEHYGLDRLVTYGLESIPETTRVVNPAHRALEAAVRKRNGLLSRRRAEFAALALDQPIAPQSVEHWEQRKAALLEEIAALAVLLAEATEIGGCRPVAGRRRRGRRRGGLRRGACHDRKNQGQGRARARGERAVGDHQRRSRASGRSPKTTTAAWK